MTRYSQRVSLLQSMETEMLSIDIDDVSATTESPDSEYEPQTSVSNSVNSPNEELEMMIQEEYHPQTFKAMNELAWMSVTQNRIDEGVQLFQHVLETASIVLGDDHPEVLTAMNGLGWTYGNQGQLTQAIELLEEVFEKRKQILGETNPETLKTMSDLAWTYAEQRVLEKAETLNAALVEYKTTYLGN